MWLTNPPSDITGDLGKIFDNRDVISRIKHLETISFSLYMFESIQKKFRAVVASSLGGSTGPELARDRQAQPLGCCRL